MCIYFKDMNSTWFSNLGSFLRFSCIFYRFSLGFGSFRACDHYIVKPFQTKSEERETKHKIESLGHSTHFWHVEKSDINGSFLVLACNLIFLVKSIIYIFNLVEHRLFIFGKLNLISISLTIMRFQIIVRKSRFNQVYKTLFGQIEFLRIGFKLLEFLDLINTYVLVAWNQHIRIDFG